MLCSDIPEIWNKHQLLLSAEHFSLHRTLVQLSYFLTYCWLGSCFGRQKSSWQRTENFRVPVTIQIRPCLKCVSMGYAQVVCEWDIVQYTRHFCALAERLMIENLACSFACLRMRKYPCLLVFPTSLRAYSVLSPKIGTMAGSARRQLREYQPFHLHVSFCICWIPSVCVFKFRCGRIARISCFDRVVTYISTVMAAACLKIWEWTSWRWPRPTLHQLQQICTRSEKYASADYSSVLLFLTPAMHNEKWLPISLAGRIFIHQMYLRNCSGKRRHLCKSLIFWCVYVISLNCAFIECLGLEERAHTCKKLSIVPCQHCQWGTSTYMWKAFHRPDVLCSCRAGISASEKGLANPACSIS